MSVDDQRSAQLKLAPNWLALACLVSIALIAAAHIKGGYIDEYYTFSFVDSTVPLRNAFEGWSRDSGHPVGFYALSRLGDLLLAPDIFIRRLSNLLYFVIALLVAWCAGRGQRSFGLLYLASLAASPYVVERFAEYRSTFLGLMIIAMLVIRLRLAVHGALNRSNILVITLLGAWLGLVDYPIAISALALFSAWGFTGLMHRNFRVVGASAFAAAACLLTVGGSILNGARFHQLANPYFETFTDLARDLVVVAGTAILPCLAMIGLALVGIRRARGSILQATVRTTFLQLLLWALVIAAVGLIIINAETHALIRRQLFGVVPLVIAYLTEAAVPYLTARPFTVALIGANLLGVSGASAIALASKRNFDRYGPEIASAQRSCATLPVYAIVPEKLIARPDNRFWMPDQFKKGLGDVAHRYGFRIRESVPADGWIDPACGAIFWSEAAWLNSPPTVAFLVSKLGIQIDPKVQRSAKIEWADQEQRRQYSLLMRVPGTRRSAALAS